MSVGLNIGGALFSLTSLAAGLTGPSLPIAMIISSIPVMLTILPYSMFTSAWPTTSATYRYSQLLSPALAVVSGLTLFVCIMIGGQPLFSLTFGLYLNKLVPISPVLTGLIVLTAFYLVNLFGIKLTGVVQTFLFFVLLSALFLYIVLGINHVDLVNLSNPFPHGIGGLMAASGLLFTFCAGGLFVIDLGGEVIKAEKSLPRALLLGMIIVVIIYALIHVITVGSVEWTALKGKTLITVAKGFMGPVTIGYFIIGGALVACATTINIIFSIASRGLLVVSEDGILPSFLSRVNERFGTPHWGLTISYLICAISLVSIPSLMFFGSMLNFGLIFSISVVCLAAIVAIDRFPKIYEKSGLKVSPGTIKIVSYVIVTMNTLIFLFFSIVLKKVTLLFIAIILCSYVYALTKKQALTSIKAKRITDFS